MRRRGRSWSGDSCAGGAVQLRSVLACSAAALAILGLARAARAVDPRRRPAERPVVAALRVGPERVPRSRGAGAARRRLDPSGSDRPPHRDRGERGSIVVRGGRSGSRSCATVRWSESAASTTLDVPLRGRPARRDPWLAIAVAIDNTLLQALRTEPPPPPPGLASTSVAARRRAPPPSHRPLPAPAPPRGGAPSRGARRRARRIGSDLIGILGAAPVPRRRRRARLLRADASPELRASASRGWPRPGAPSRWARGA